MKENKIVKQAGAWYEYVDTETGEKFKFRPSLWNVKKMVSEIKSYATVPN